jgi:hypothetical protein
MINVDNRVEVRDIQGDLRGIENATHNTLQQKAGHRSGKYPGFSPDELRVAFSIPSGSLFFVNHPVYNKE